MPKVLRINKTLLLPSSHEAIHAAARIIRRGGLVAFPTETVYGLGAAAANSRAVKNIFAAKGRPADNPLIVHVSSLDQVKDVVSSIPRSAVKLMRRFWPGPLSLVLPSSAVLPREVSAGLPTVAVRMPAHPVALSLIRSAGVPIAAPSANRSGRPSPTTSSHVLADLAGRIDAVLDGGSSPLGLESTVLDLSGSSPVILRPGAVSREQLEEALGEGVAQAQAGKGGFPPCPGMKHRHYTPRAPLFLITGSCAGRRGALIRTLAAFYRKEGLKVGIWQALPGPGGLRLASGDLFMTMRRFDAQGVQLILAEGIPSNGLGMAVMNRLREAAQRIIRV